MPALSFPRRRLLLLALLAGCEGEAILIGPERPLLSGPADAVSSAAKQAQRPRLPEWKRLANSWVHPSPIPSFELTDHNGKKFRLRDFGNDHVLVGLIFTSCSVPKACPLTTQKMYDTAKLWKATQDKRDRSLRFLTLTFDPENDTPAKLKDYGKLLLQDFGEYWTLATGPMELMEETLPAMFGVRARDSGDTIAHNVRAALLAPGLRKHKEWRDNSFAPEEVIAEVLR